MKRFIGFFLLGLSIILSSCSKEVKVGGITIFDPNGGEKALKDLSDIAKQGKLEDDVARAVGLYGKDQELIDGRLKIKGQFLKYDNNGCALVRIYTYRYDEEIKEFLLLDTKTKRVCF